MFLRRKGRCFGQGRGRGGTNHIYFPGRGEAESSRGVGRAHPYFHAKRRSRSTPFLLRGKGEEFARIPKPLEEGGSRIRNLTADLRAGIRRPPGQEAIFAPEEKREGGRKEAAFLCLTSLKRGGGAVPRASYPSKRMNSFFHEAEIGRREILLPLSPSTTFLYLQEERREKESTIVFPSNSVKKKKESHNSSEKEGEVWVPFLSLQGRKREMALRTLNRVLLILLRGRKREEGRWEGEKVPLTENDGNRGGEKKVKCPELTTV